jgi:hypothetical protein
MAGQSDEGGVQIKMYDGLGVSRSVTWGDPVTDAESTLPPSDSLLAISREPLTLRWARIVSCTRCECWIQ